MQRTVIAITVLLGAVLSAHAATPTPKHQKPAASSSGVVTYIRDLSYPECRLALGKRHAGLPQRLR